MDIKKLILKKLRITGQVTSAELVKATGFSRVYINRFLKQLINEGKIYLIGKANLAKYVLANSRRVKPGNLRKILKNKGLNEDMVLDEVKNGSSIFKNLPGNIASTLSYAFTEMLNNAIEHSSSKILELKIAKTAKDVNFELRDFGVGVFKKVAKKFRLKTESDAINHLLKGKQTTAPAAHSGEGIFFTSKVADVFILESFKKKLVIDNLSGNIFIKNIKSLKGTRVTFKKTIKSKISLDAIFKEYAGENFEFSKTKVLVNLGAIDKSFLSRSQARRIIFGLDKFKEITFDFKGVETVGQSFADEIFRVWQNNHAGITIKFQNANGNSLLMIKWAKA
jgi:hypothetical protein